METIQEMSTKTLLSVSSSKVHSSLIPADSYMLTPNTPLDESQLSSTRPETIRCLPDGTIYLFRSNKDSNQNFRWLTSVTMPRR